MVVNIDLPAVMSARPEVASMITQLLGGTESSSVAISSTKKSKVGVGPVFQGKSDCSFVGDHPRARGSGEDDDGNFDGPRRGRAPAL